MVVMVGKKVIVTSPSHWVADIPSIYPPQPPTPPPVPMLTSLSSLTASQAMTFSSSTIIPHLSPSVTNAVYPLACFFPFPFPFFIFSIPTSAAFPYLCSFSALKNRIHLCLLPPIPAFSNSSSTLTPSFSLLLPSSSSSYFLVKMFSGVYR